ERLDRDRGVAETEQAEGAADRAGARGRREGEDRRRETLGRGRGCAPLGAAAEGGQGEAEAMAAEVLGPLMSPLEARPRQVEPGRSERGGVGVIPTGERVGEDGHADA